MIAWGADRDVMQAVLKIERWDSLEYVASVETGACEMFLDYPQRVHSNTNMIPNLTKAGLSSIMFQTFGKDGNRSAGAAIRRIRMLAARDHYEHQQYGAHDAALESMVESMPEVGEAEEEMTGREFDDKTTATIKASVQDLQSKQTQLKEGVDGLHEKFESISGGFATAGVNGERILQVLETSTAKIDDDVSSIAAQCADMQGAVVGVADTISTLQLYAQTVAEQKETIAKQKKDNDRLRNEKGNVTHDNNILQAEIVKLTNINKRECKKYEEKIAAMDADKDIIEEENETLKATIATLETEKKTLDEEHRALVAELVAQLRESRRVMSLLVASEWSQDLLQAHKRARPNDDA